MHFFYSLKGIKDIINIIHFIGENNEIGSKSSLIAFTL